MKQIFSNQQTIYIQATFSVVVMGVGIWISYARGFVPNYTGVVGWGEFIFVVWAWSFAGASLVGGIMWVMNLFFYQIQVLRHGPPHEQIEHND